MTLDDLDIDTPTASPTTIIQPDVPNGIFTIQFPCGTHKTLKIHTGQHGNFKGRRIISLLIGPSNSDDYEASGELTPTPAGFFVWKRYQNTRVAHYVMLLVKMMRGEVFENHELMASRTCFKCNRTLTTPAAVLRGYGDECWRLLNKTKK